MAEEMISKERIDYTIDLLITMAVEEIAEDTGKSPKEILPEFYSSKTGIRHFTMSRPDYGKWPILYCRIIHGRTLQKKDLRKSCF